MTGPFSIECEETLVDAAIALGARGVKGWSEAEENLTRRARLAPSGLVRALRAAVLAGRDPLGGAFALLRSPEIRRPLGATYTPGPIVRSMLAWAAANSNYARVVDPGVGSGRFLVAAGRRFRDAALIGIEVDPLAALIARAHLASAGLAARSEVVLCEYQGCSLPAIDGRTLFIGNPPYVRHHLINGRCKEWLARTAEARGLDASQLAGLHVHFFLATVLLARAGDFGSFITAAEWLDVNYGRLLRQLFVGDLGGRSITLIEPTARPFPDAMTTATITCFEIGARPKSIRLKRCSTLSELGSLGSGQLIRRERIEGASRWTPLTRSARKRPEGYVELGELCRVHRGQVTGANDIWISGEHSAYLPEAVLFPSVTRARELFSAGSALRPGTHLRRVIDLPVDLDCVTGEDRKRIDRFLRHARSRGAHEGYIARTRRAWWAVELRAPAKILATYMARRPPAFVRNLADARHLNIAHGIYPREELSDLLLDALAAFLGKNVALGDGRTYAGGLTKFEPREMERILVPDLPLLSVMAKEPRSA